MKIGFVLECQRGGPDAQICRWIAEEHCARFEWTQDACR